MSFYGGGRGYLQQPSTGYPGAAPGYPQAGPGMPMPDQGSPYPGQAPYPGAGAPYPTGPTAPGGLPYPVQPPSAAIGFGGGIPQPAAPYPGASQPAAPYPGASQPAPYPGAAQPAAHYPGASSSPYQGAAQPAAPYPGASSSPYAGAAQPAAPYPGASSSPYAGAAQPAAPYPGGPPQPSASPYPGAQQPYMANTAGGYGTPSALPPGPATYSAPPSGGYHTPVPRQQPQYNPQSQPAPTAGMQNLNIGSSNKPSSQVATPSQYKKPLEQGTLKPHSPFNAEDDCQKLRKAMKGIGTDEKAIIDILGHRIGKQRQEIKLMFKTMFGKNLVNDLKSELGGKFEDVVLALMMPADEYDAYELNRAMRGAGTDEDAMIEILTSRSNAEIQAASTAYKKLYGHTLESDIKGDTSGHFGRLMISLATGGRMENQAVDMNKATMDAKALYDAGEKKWGTDESRFNAILASQSYEQLRAVFDEYGKITGRTIEKAIEGEMSGYLEKGMLTIVKVVRNKDAYFAEKLYKSMKGLGTDDKTLIRVIVSRCEVDMVQIKQLFMQIYGKTLAKFITDDTSGHYKRILLSLTGETY